MSDMAKPEGGDEGNTRCGFAALVGRPNVGKSTLLNALLGRKLSIVSPKPQTTRNRIHGVLTRPGLQIVFVDLPGLHDNQSRAINRCMNRTALASLADSDVKRVRDRGLRFTPEDERALERLKAAGRPVILLVNKIDRARPRERLLPFVAGRVGKSRVCRSPAGVGAAQRRHRPPARADRELSP
jgi:GTP-binding protein Era